MAASALGLAERRHENAHGERPDQRRDRSNGGAIVSGPARAAASSALLDYAVQHLGCHLVVLGDSSKGPPAPVVAFALSASGQRLITS
jgi:hypothetical protein